MAGKHGLFLIPKRNFSLTQELYRKGKTKNGRISTYIRYPNIYEEHPRSERNDVQRLLNKGRKLFPYDKRLPVTGKNTGLGVEGGSVEAEQLAAVHRVPPVGFLNKRGQFKHIPELQTEFVVPDLSNFHLQPYVPYDRVPEVKKGRHTARELFDAFYADEIKEDFFAKQEEKQPKKKTLLDKFKKT
ncbi:39S ribosomal protein L41, mitochondrial-like [Mercenaria mercenaria]|uniref:39S ribosomal protein L41, mitochondrial-like n=1 Tax=Mercenaria mercenaria TaxID=6596 RepID=UPI001E1D7634|nr:39S ribosomal protein L41, mitochondrial-like [Mercenaria mercenaria]